MGVGVQEVIEQGALEFEDAFVDFGVFAGVAELKAAALLLEMAQEVFGGLPGSGPKAQCSSTCMAIFCWSMGTGWKGSGAFSFTWPTKARSTQTPPM